MLVIEMDSRETGIDRLLRHSMAAPVPILPADFDKRVMRELHRSPRPLHLYRRILLTGYGLTSVVASAAVMHGQGLGWILITAMIAGPLALLAVVPWARSAK